MNRRCDRQERLTACNNYFNKLDKQVNRMFWSIPVIVITMLCVAVTTLGGIGYVVYKLLSHFGVI